MNKPRQIMLIDMNAYFASVEQQTNPALRDKPIAVVGAGHRTVIVTCSYEARARGVNPWKQCLDFPKNGSKVHTVYIH
jgi:DNA polymerase-4